MEAESAISFTGDFGNVRREIIAQRQISYQKAVRRLMQSQEVRELLVGTRKCRRAVQRWRWRSACRVNAVPTGTCVQGSLQLYPCGIAWRDALRTHIGMTLPCTARGRLAAGSHAMNPACRWSKCCGQLAWSCQSCLMRKRECWRFPWRTACMHDAPTGAPLPTPRSTTAATLLDGDQAA